MKSYNNEKGFALITALMITMICLIMILGIMATITKNTQLSAINKVYQNAVDASYGGADLALFEMLPRLAGAADATTMQTLMDTMNFASFNASNDCLYDKLTNNTADWTKCATGSSTTDPKASTDYNVTLNGPNGMSFIVHSKIVDTSKGAPYISGVTTPLGGAGVASENNPGSDIHLDHFVYRVEVSAEKSENQTEKGSVSVLYEY